MADVKDAPAKPAAAPPAQPAKRQKHEETAASTRLIQAIVNDTAKLQTQALAMTDPKDAIALVQVLWRHYREQALPDAPPFADTSPEARRAQITAVYAKALHQKLTLRLRRTPPNFLEDELLRRPDPLVFRGVELWYMNDNDDTVRAYELLSEYPNLREVQIIGPQAFDPLIRIDLDTAAFWKTLKWQQLRTLVLRATRDTDDEEEEKDDDLPEHENHFWIVMDGPQSQNLLPFHPMSTSPHSMPELRTLELRNIQLCSQAQAEAWFDEEDRDPVPGLSEDAKNNLSVDAIVGEQLLPNPKLMKELRLSGRWTWSRSVYTVLEQQFPNLVTLELGRERPADARHPAPFPGLDAGDLLRLAASAPNLKRCSVHWQDDANIEWNRSFDIDWFVKSSSFQVYGTHPLHIKLLSAFYDQKEVKILEDYSDASPSTYWSWDSIMNLPFWKLRAEVAPWTQSLYLGCPNALSVEHAQFMCRSKLKAWSLNDKDGEGDDIEWYVNTDPDIKQCYMDCVGPTLADVQNSVLGVLKCLVESYPRGEIQTLSVTLPRYSSDPDTNLAFVWDDALFELLDQAGIVDLEFFSHPYRNALFTFVLDSRFLFPRRIQALTGGDEDAEHRFGEFGLVWTLPGDPMSFALPLSEIGRRFVSLTQQASELAKESKTLTSLRLRLANAIHIEPVLTLVARQLTSLAIVYDKSKHVALAPFLAEDFPALLETICSNNPNLTRLVLDIDNSQATRYANLFPPGTPRRDALQKAKRFYPIKLAKLETLVLYLPSWFVLYEELDTIAKGCPLLEKATFILVSEPEEHKHHPVLRQWNDQWSRHPTHPWPIRPKWSLLTTREDYPEIVRVDVTLFEGDYVPRRHLYVLPDFAPFAAAPASPASPAVYGSSDRKLVPTQSTLAGNLDRVDQERIDDLYDQGGEIQRREEADPTLAAAAHLARVIESASPGTTVTVHDIGYAFDVHGQNVVTMNANAISASGAIREQLGGLFQGHDVQIMYR